MRAHANAANAPSSSQTGNGGLIGESVPMQRLNELIGKFSQSTSPVLLLGETGTGKELAARAIHYRGSRSDKALVPVDCSALTGSLIESELFGHVKGAFTGADRLKQGLFQAASEGTIFLDEVGELPMLLQAKLLRALQEKEIRLVGSTERVQINVRVIAATNRDLEAEVRAGTFRQDLYFRLNVVQIKLPSLRERSIDIPILVAHFLKKFSDPLQAVCAVTDGALRRLMDHNWPGNVRELENAIECAVALCSGNILTVDDLTFLPSVTWGEGLPDCNKLIPLVEMERRAILHALQETDGDKDAAARLLQIGRTTLYRKLKEYTHVPSQPSDESAKRVLWPCETNHQV